MVVCLLMLSSDETNLRSEVKSGLASPESFRWGLHAK